MKTTGNAPIFGMRLKVARKMAGLSMDDLVKKCEGLITKQAISKYERGKMNPSSEVLIHLSNILGIKPDFFLRSSSLQLSQFNFRKRSELSKKDEQAIKLQAIEFLERYHELEHILGLKSPFKNPLKNIQINNQEDVERAAEKLRNKWHLGLTSPIMNLLNLLEKKGIKIFFINKNKNLDGLSTVGDKSPVMVLNQGKPKDRMRFTASHELAHIICNFADDTKCEEWCHAFASAFLLPRDVLRQELLHKRRQITFWELGIIKQNFGISMRAILWRARKLEIINEYHFQTLLNTMKEKGWDVKEPVEFNGREEPLHFRQLLNYALTEEIISQGKAAELADMPLSQFKNQLQVP